jgi:hypothetical protein
MYRRFKMPRIISDELFNQLTGCLRQQRLLGVMGMIERMEKEAIFVYDSTGCYTTGIMNAGMDGYEVKERTWTEDYDGPEQQANSN